MLLSAVNIDNYWHITGCSRKKDIALAVPRHRMAAVQEGPGAIAMAIVRASKVPGARHFLPRWQYLGAMQAGVTVRRSFPGVCGAAAWMLLSTLGAHAASPDQLYQTWEKNYLTDPAVSEKAAEDYLRAAPRGPHAQDLKLWLDAYQKAVANLMAQSTPPPAAKASQTRLASAIPQVNPAQNNPTPKQPPTLPPAAKPAGQSLDELLAFIADKIEDRLNFTAEFVNPSGGTRVEQLTYAASDVTIDPNRCQVSYRWHVVQDGNAAPDEDRAVQLRFSKSIGVETIDQALGDLNDNHSPVHAHPQAYAVHIARWDKPSGDNLYFRERGMAESVAGAAQHALELCDKAAGRSGR
jgi:hypothetical protein